MKKWIAAVLSLLCLAGLAGCQKEEPAAPGTAFYYCAADMAYGMDAAAIQAEYRQVDAQEPLPELLEYYLAGPASAALRSPFPAALRLLDASVEGSTVYITVTDALAALSGLELTLACSCISLTCMELTGAEAVVISAQDALLAGQKSITMDKNSILLLDTVSEGE